MFRINLLPKEVQERRRYEGAYRWVFILAAGLIIFVGLTYLGLWVSAQGKTGDVQNLEEQVATTNAQAEQLSIFQNKEEELQKRQVIAQTALASRVNAGEVANDISLVLPDEVWLDLLTINQDTGVVLSANTPRQPGQSTDIAYKSVAKTLVRLNELPELYDVWLNTAANAMWSQWAPKADQSGGTPAAVRVVSFQASGKVVRAGVGQASAGSAGSDAGTHTVGAANAAQSAVNAANNVTNATTSTSQ